MYRHERLAPTIFPVSSEIKKEIRLEIGHVLFVDIGNYSKLHITEQSEQIQKTFCSVAIGWRGVVKAP
jgi:hypothetical protein